MASLGEITIGLTPELKELLESVSAKIDALNERLDKQTQPLEVKIVGRDLQGLLRKESYKELRTE